MIIKKLKLLWLALLLSTATLFAGFQNVHCDNENNLTILKLPQVECEILDAFWTAMGDGAGWTDKTGWDTVTYAGDWSGVYMYDDNSSIKWFGWDNTIGNNLTGVLPSNLTNFIALEVLGLGGNNLYGTLPELSLSNSLYFLSFIDNQFTGSIPNSYAQLTKLTDLLVNGNQLSGSLPDLSALTVLDNFRIQKNNFTFSDIEPQINDIKDILQTQYSDQLLINESTHPIVYFDDALVIEPKLAANPSKHDYYIWKKDNAIIEDTSTYTNEDFSQSRIYVKENATQADEGCYSYDVNNSKVTLPDGSGIFRNLVLHSNTCIHAVYEHAPVVDNLTPSLTTSENITYTYTSAISDADNDTLTVTASSLPSWLTLTSDDANFTLSGTPTFNDAGNYDINLTVTDGKIPVHIDYTLTVEENIPTGYTIVGDSYVHTATGTSIAVGNAYYDSFPEVNVNNDISLYTKDCDIWRNVYERLTTSGVLTTGYFNNCAGDTESPTLSTAYPLGSKATFIEEPNSAEHQPMIMIEIPLTDATPSVTIGGN